MKVGDKYTFVQFVKISSVYTVLSSLYIKSSSQVPANFLFSQRNGSLTTRSEYIVLVYRETMGELFFRSSSVFCIFFLKKKGCWN